MKIINIGSIPPPVGGVTYFLKRLKEKTDHLNPEKYVYYDVSGKEHNRKKKEHIICTSRFGVIVHLLREPRGSYIIFHSNSAGHLLIQRLFQRWFKFIYFAHGESILKNRSSWEFTTLQSAKFIVTPTKQLYEKCIKIYGNEKVRHIPFILFPEQVKESSDRIIRELRSQVDFLICGYACHLNSYNGVQLYGTDMMTRLVYDLRNKGYNAGCICLVSDIANQSAFAELHSQVHNYDIADYFIIMDKKIEEAIELYKAVDLYIRPTNTDGDAFSIWEALYAGTPVLASDATQRPEGCILFKTRDNKDFFDRTQYIIENYNEIKQQTEALAIKGNEEQIIDFFEDLK